MEYKSYSDVISEAIQSVKFSMDVDADRTDTIIKESNCCYQKVQKILECPEMEKGHKFCLDIDFDHLDNDTEAKVDKLFNLGVERGFLSTDGLPEVDPDGRDEFTDDADKTDADDTDIHTDDDYGIDMYDQYKTAMMEAAKFGDIDSEEENNEPTGVQNEGNMNPDDAANDSVHTSDNPYNMSADEYEERQKYYAELNKADADEVMPPDEISETGDDTADTDTSDTDTDTDNTDDSADNTDGDSTGATDKTDDSQDDNSGDDSNDNADNADSTEDNSDTSTDNSSDTSTDDDKTEDKSEDDDKSDDTSDDDNKDKDSDKDEDKDEKEEKLTAEQKEQMKGDYEKAFVDVLTKMEVEISVSDMSPAQKAEFWKNLSEKWTGNDPADFMKVSDLNKLEKKVIEK